MKIDIEKLDALVGKADEIFLKPEGEKVLLDLLKIEDQVSKAIKEAKEKLEKAALKISPDFKSIQGDSVKVFYRCYGSKYYIDEMLEDQVPKELKKVTKRVVVDTKALGSYMKIHKGLPVGIITADRTKQITFKPKEEV